MKPILEVYLGSNPELNASIEVAVAQLCTRHRACITVRKSDNQQAQIIDSQSNGNVLVSGADQVLGFLAGYERMADAVRDLI